jgi:toxin-antitoxin system PIN domain toxin
VIIPDVNLLLYAVVTGFPLHSAAREWWETCLNGSRSVGIAAPAIFGFLRIATNPRVLTDPMSITDATDEVRRWLRQPHAHLVVPGSRHLDLAFPALVAAGTGGNLTTDAQLAALAIENNAELHSNDSDFARFEGLRWRNPIA